jgi:D-xylose transport system permease protein
MTTTVESQPANAVAPAYDNSLGGHARAYLDKIRGGDLGALPAVLGLVVLLLLFGVLMPDTFVSLNNLQNLFQQAAPIVIISMGLVFVLLLGDIDLSAGYTAGLSAAVFVSLVTERAYAWPVALLIALATGLIVGLVIGLLVEKVGIPSFVVTLAMFLALQGVALLILSGGRNITLFDPTIKAIENDNISPWLGWTIWAVCIGGYAGIQFWRRLRRGMRGLVTDPLALIAVRIVAIAVITGGLVYALNLNRAINKNFAFIGGVPIIVPVLLILLFVTQFVLSRTSFGRHLYAIGGNREAARRAGIRVTAIRITAFVICSGMAFIGGIVLASRSAGVYPDIGGSTVLLYSVGAAVIGGTSLMGGRGRTLDALIGGLLIAVIDNGMGLLGSKFPNSPIKFSDSSTKYIVTAIVLLLAATIDALSRRRAAAAGR